MAVQTQALPTLLTSRPQVSLVAKSLAAKDFAEERVEAKPAPRLPEAYAMSICVRNTFIDTDDELSPSLERFYRRREVSTCPSAHIGRFSRLFEEEADDSASKCGSNDDMDTRLPSECHETRSASEASPSNAVAPAGPSCVLSLAEALNLPDEEPVATPTWEGQAAFGEGHFVGGAVALEVPYDSFGDWHLSWHQAPAPLVATMDSGFVVGVPANAQYAFAPVDMVSAHGTPPPQVAAVDAESAAPPPQSAPSSGCAEEEAPSVGSVLHSVAGCKPCAFFHTVGCGNGSSCEFCHLCGPDERKRRRKAKLEALREDRLCKANRQGATAESRRARAAPELKV